MTNGNANINRLSFAEAERLALLAEECAEVVTMVGKTLRHGYESVNPLKLEDGTNRDRLIQEIGDVISVIRLMAVKGDFKWADVNHAATLKDERMKPWLHYQHK